MDFAYEYAEMAASAQFEDLPSHAVEMTKRFLLDTLGVAIAGANRAEAQNTVNLVREWGGKAESSLLFFGDKLPVIHAVFANSVMIHALDFDDTHDGAVVHAYVTGLPVAFGMAERLGSVSGKDFILALNLGIDLTCRLGLAIGACPGFETKTIHFIRSAVCGCFGACMVAGKLLGFSVEHLVNALGIVLSQVGGTRQVVVDSAMTKRFQPAFAAKSGVLSALLGDTGISGCRGVFEGPYGFFNNYWGGDYLREELTRNLGHHFEGVNLSFKPYPCCRYNHGAIDAILKCIKTNNITDADVKSVLIHLPKQKFYDVVSRPFSIRNDPTVDAQFNIPYCVASALIDGYVFLDTFEAETVKIKRRTAVAEKVKVLMDLPVKDKKILGSVIVEINTNDNRTYSETVEDYKGNPGNPMTRDECVDKFMRCLRYVNHPFSEGNIETCIKSIFDIEHLEDVTDIIEYLT